MGLKTSKWHGTYAAVPLTSHSTPTPCFRTLCLNLPCHKSRKPTVTQKVLVTLSSNIVHCNQHTQKPVCTDFQAFSNTFPLFKLMGFFFSFFVRGVQQTAKNLTFCWFWMGKMHWNGLSGAYLGFEACQIQWHKFWVSMISGSWKITISGKNFTFCWFWLGKIHQNGLSGVYVVFKACWIQWHLFQVSMIRGSWKIKIFGNN